MTLQISTVNVLLKEVIMSLENAVNGLFVSFIGNMTTSFVMNDSFFVEDINEFAKQFSQAVVSELQKDKEIILSDLDKKNLESSIEAKMVPIVSSITKALENAKKQLYGDYDIDINMPLADAAVRLTGQSKNLAKELVDRSKLQEEKLGKNMLLEIIEYIKEFLGIAEKNTKQEFVSLFEKQERNFVDKYINTTGNKEQLQR